MQETNQRRIEENRSTKFEIEMRNWITLILEFTTEKDFTKVSKISNSMRNELKIFIYTDVQFTVIDEMGFHVILKLFE